MQTAGKKKLCRQSALFCQSLKMYDVCPCNGSTHYLPVDQKTIDISSFSVHYYISVFMDIEDGRKSFSILKGVIV